MYKISQCDINLSMRLIEKNKDARTLTKVVAIIVSEEITKSLSTTKAGISDSVVETIAQKTISALLNNEDFTA